MHWLIHIWFAVIVGMAVFALYRTYKKQSAKGGGVYNSDPDWFGFTVGLLATVAICMIWSGLTMWPPEEGPPRMTKAERMADRYEKAGIVCAEDMDNDSGNVCRVKLGDEECVAILPDDDTKTSFNKKDLYRCTKGD